MTIERLLQEEMGSCGCPDVKLEETGLGCRTGTLTSHVWHLSGTEASACVGHTGDEEADLAGPTLPEQTRYSARRRGICGNQRKAGTNMPRLTGLRGLSSENRSDTGRTGVYVPRTHLT